MHRVQAHTRIASMKSGPNRSHPPSYARARTPAAFHTSDLCARPRHHVQHTLKASLAHPIAQKLFTLKMDCSSRH